MFILHAFQHLTCLGNFVKEKNNPCLLYYCGDHKDTIYQVGLNQCFLRRDGFASTGHLSVSGDIFVKSGWRPMILLNILKAQERHSPNTEKNYPAKNVDNPEIENLWSKSRWLCRPVIPVTRKVKAEGSSSRKAWKT